MAKKHTIILVTGGSCSGKSVFASLTKHALIVSMDHFYKGKSKMIPDEHGNYNFDAPDSVNIEEFAQAVESLAQGNNTDIPVYDMVTSERKGKQTLSPAPDTKFIVAEGIFSFYSPLRELGDIKIFIDTPTEIRVARRMLRDEEKGRNELDTLSWSITVEKNHKQYVEPMKQYADIVVPFSYNPVQFMG